MLDEGQLKGKHVAINGGLLLITTAVSHKCWPTLAWLALCAGGWKLTPGPALDKRQKIDGWN